MHAWPGWRDTLHTRSVYASNDSSRHHQKRVPGSVGKYRYEDGAGSRTAAFATIHQHVSTKGSSNKASGRQISRVLQLRDDDQSMNILVVGEKHNSAEVGGNRMVIPFTPTSSGQGTDIAKPSLYAFGLCLTTLGMEFGYASKETPWNSSFASYFRLSHFET